MATDPIVHNGELTSKAAFVLGHILGAWFTFRQSYDLSRPSFTCKSSDALFEALAQYEKMMFPKD